MTHDLILLGGTYLRNSNYEQALKCFNQAVKISSQYPSLKAKSIMYLAATKYKIGQIDSALLLIRGTPSRSKPYGSSQCFRICFKYISKSWYFRHGIYVCKRTYI